jgi:hypothetical protein
LLRGAEKVLQVLARLKPLNAGDLNKLKRLFDVLGKIAVAVAQSAVLVAETVGEVVKYAADLLAVAALKVAEVLLALLKRLAELIPPFDANSPELPAVDIELRIALDPLELRQIMITLRGNGPARPANLSKPCATPPARPASGPMRRRSR